LDTLKRTIHGERGKQPTWCEAPHAKGDEIFDLETGLPLLKIVDDPSLEKCVKVYHARGPSGPSKKKPFVTKEQVKSMIKSSENNLIKYFDAITSVNGLTGGAHIFSVTMPTSGTGESAMNGTSIDIDRFELCYTINDIPNVFTDTYAVRVILFQAIGESTILVSDVLQTNSTQFVQVVSPYNYANHNKSYRVISDTVRVIDSYNTVAHYKNDKLRPKVKRCRYDSSNTVWAAGQVYLLVINADYAGGTDMGFNLILRSWFYDV